VYVNGIEDLKSGQLINGNAIQSLAESISYITSVISQLQPGNSAEENSDTRKLSQKNQQPKRPKH
jgi:hypothetical protein